MSQGFLGDVVIVQPDVAMNRRLQRSSAVEAVGGEHFADAAVETFDHAVRLRAARFGQPMLDVERLAQFIEGMRSRRSTLAASDEAVGELLAVVGEDRVQTKRGRLDERAQKAPGVGGSLLRVDGHEHPTRGPVDRHEEGAALVLVRHLR
jgi:hypothetical protein